MTKTNNFLVVSKTTGIENNVATVILVYEDFLVTDPKSDKNGPSKLLFGLVRVLRGFGSPVGWTALKLGFIYLVW